MCVPRRLTTWGTEATFRSGMQRSPMPARGLADEGGERVDDGARVGPAAGDGGVDDRGDPS